jgi:hypothetical protein
MLELFFISFGIVYMEFIPERATVNKHCYKDILRHLCNSIQYKHSELWGRKNWLLLYDKTLCTCPSRAGKTTCHCFTMPSILNWSHTIWFLFFPRLKEKLYGRRFQHAEEIGTVTRDAVWDLPASQVKVILRPMVSWPVRPGVGPPSWSCNQLFLSFPWKLYWHLQLTWGWVCNLWMLLGFTSASCLGSESHGTHDHTSLS